MKISTATFIATIMLASFNVLAESAHLIEKQCIAEPIFEGEACVYQANQSAEKTVILVHGLNGEALRDWQYQIPALAENYHVLTFDLPGFGDSGKEVADYSPREYAKFINFIAERYAHGKTILVGHSMGGAISIRYSEMYSENIEKLVLVDVAGVLHRMAYSRELMKGWLKSKVSDDSSVLSFADKFANNILGKVEPVIGPLSRFMDDYVIQNDYLDMGSSTISAVSLVHEDLTDALSSLKMPTTIIWGEKDSIAPLRTAKVLKKYLPQADLNVIKNAAHVPMIDEPEKFNKLLLTFINIDTQEQKKSQTLLTENSSDKNNNEICNDEVGKVYEGYFETLTIINCSQVLISNAVIEELVIRTSSVSIENSNITSEKTAIDVLKSDLLITASNISGETAIYSSGSRLDLAGVTLNGKEFVINGNATSSIVFSVSNIHSEYESRDIHEFLRISRKTPL